MRLTATLNDWTLLLNSTSILVLAFAFLVHLNAHKRGRK